MKQKQTEKEGQCGSGYFTNKYEKEYLPLCKEHDQRYAEGHHFFHWLYADTLFVTKVLRKALSHLFHALRGVIYAILVTFCGWFFFIQTQRNKNLLVTKNSEK